MQWGVPVIPAIWEMAVERSGSEASMGKSMRPFLKRKLKAKGLVAWLKF
jgi:hypothetical protein